MLGRLNEHRTPCEVKREHEILLSRAYLVIKKTKRVPWDMFFQEGNHLRRGLVMVYRVKTVSEAETLRDLLVTTIMPSELERSGYMEGGEQFYMLAGDVSLAIHIAWGVDYD